MQNQDLIIKMVVNNWDLQVSRAKVIIDQITFLCIAEVFDLHLL